MNWQKSLARVVKALRIEEARLERELATVKHRIAGVTGVVGGAAAAKGPKKRRNMSAAARAAISRAAKKRWAKYRAEKAGS